MPMSESLKVHQPLSLGACISAVIVTNDIDKSMHRMELVADEELSHHRRSLHEPVSEASTSNTAGRRHQNSDQHRRRREGLRQEPPKGDGACETDVTNQCTHDEGLRRLELARYKPKLAALQPLQSYYLFSCLWNVPTQFLATEML